MAYNKVEICGINTSKLPILNEDEKKELFDKILKGDDDAFKKYIYGNLRLVLSVVQRFSNRGEYMDDLFQVGCIGLIKAVKNFDIAQNVKFSTYAVPMIMGEVRRHLRDYTPIRISRSIRDSAYHALQAKERLTKEKGREPDIEEIAKELNMRKDEVVMALSAIQEPVSLFEPVYHDGGDPIFVMDQVKDEKNKDSKWLENIALNEAIEKLGEREKKIIDLRFFEGKTQMEVSEEIGISQAQVSRLEKSALKQMRKYV